MLDCRGAVAGLTLATTLPNRSPLPARLTEISKPPLLAARAPFDLIIANILAGPLIELAPAFARALLSGGNVILAGLLDSQAKAVSRAYEVLGFKLTDNGTGEWPVLVLKGPTE